MAVHQVNMFNLAHRYREQAPSHIKKHYCGVLA